MMAQVQNSLSLSAHRVLSFMRAALVSVNSDTSVLLRG
jgi:hypothetical protein